MHSPLNASNETNGAVIGSVLQLNASNRTKEAAFDEVYYKIGQDFSDKVHKCSIE